MNYKNIPLLASIFFLTACSEKPAQEKPKAENKEVVITQTQSGYSPPIQLDFPPIGTLYKKDSGLCSSPPSTSQISDTYVCSSFDQKQRYSFDKNGNLNAVWFRGSLPNVATELVLAALYEKFGAASNLQTGKLWSNDVTGVTFGCKGYILEKPGSSLRYDTPNYNKRKAEFQSVLLETGSVLMPEYYSYSDFEIDKREIAGIKQCVVASIWISPKNIPRELGEEQLYITNYIVVAVNPLFPYITNKEWGGK